MTSAVTATLALLAILNRYAGRSFLYPPALFAASWAIYLFLFLLSGRRFFGIADDTLFFYFWGALVFSTGGLCASACWSMMAPVGNTAASEPLTAAQRMKMHRALDIMLVLLALALPLYARYVLQLAAQANVADLWVAIRTQMIKAGESENSNSFRIMDNLVVLSQIIAFVIYYDDDGTRARRLRTFSAVGLAFVYGFMTASRSSGVNLILYLLSLHWLKHGYISRRTLVGLSVMFAFLFSALSILLSKGEAQRDATIWENVPAVVDGFLWYSVGGIVAFDTVFHSRNSIPPVQNIDRPLLQAVNKFGAGYDLPSRHAEYVAIGPGKNMNIYTFYFSYFPEFGTIGTMLVLFLLGLGLTLVYEMARQGNVQAVLLFSMLFAGIVLSGYAENLVLNVSFITKTLGFAWILYWGARRGHSTLACPPPSAC